MARRKQIVITHSPDLQAVSRVIPLDGSEWTLGRESEGPAKIRDARLSRRHVRFFPHDGGYAVEDLEAANGTFVDGKRLNRSALPIEPNQVISVGDTLLVVDEEADPDSLPAAGQIKEPRIDSVVGSSLAVQRLRRSIATVAKAHGAVLLLGSTGTGKEVTARAIHQSSGRAGAFVPVNCAAIPGQIAEAEFFGYKKGAFTGAEVDRDGYFVKADGGTLFLDEVGDLPTPLQAKLLRVLEDGTVQPLGGGSERKLNLRVIAATHVDLNTSDFRRDLMARLGDWTLCLPALVDRKSDILMLFRHFLRRNGDDAFTAEFAECLLLHNWPMNIRELKKLAGRLGNLAGADETLDIHHLPAAMRTPIAERFDELQADLGRSAPPISEIEDALREARGNVKLAAENRGWHRTQLYRWLKRANLDPTAYR